MARQRRQRRIAVFVMPSRTLSVYMIFHIWYSIYNLCMESEEFGQNPLQEAWEADAEITGQLEAAEYD